MSQQPHETVWTLATAGFAARCTHAIADLGVADRVGDRPVPVGDLAAACSVDADALDRVLRLLVVHGVFDHQDGGYVHTPSSRLLRSDHPMTMRPFVQMMGLPLIWGSLSEVRHSILTGRAALETMEPNGLWAYFQDHRAEAETFGRAMTAKAGAEVAAVVGTYDFSAFSTIADIGGGRGHLLRAVLEATPAAEGTLFDLPQVIDTLDLDHPRMTPQAGDFFVDPLPTAQAFLLMEVLHDWGDDECVAILHAIRNAALDSSTLLIIEGVITEDQPDPHARTLDIVMLTVTEGRERTASQLGALLERAGFTLDRVIDTPSPMRIVEARVL